jgi:hypothetical protein
MTTVDCEEACRNGGKARRVLLISLPHRVMSQLLVFEPPVRSPYHVMKAITLLYYVLSGYNFGPRGFAESL